MKSVTIENVKARIAQLETSEQIGGRLPIRHEFEMACLRQLVVSLEAKPKWVVISSVHGSREMVTSYNPGVHVDGEKGVRLDYAVQPAPVANDAEPSFDAMMRALDAFYADDEVPERAMLAAFKILLADVGKRQAQPAQADTDNTAQQFEALATSTKCKRCDGEGWVADEMGITQCGCGATTSAGKVKS